MKLLFGEDEIRAAVRRIAAKISADLAPERAGGRPVLVGVLKGSFVFLADLVRELSIPVELDFVRARSYGSSTRSAGTVEITKDVELDVRGRDVIVVEDIADTGLTLDAVVRRLEAQGAASVARCALLAREGCPLPEYHGFEIGPGFVVGYGIDYAEEHRELRAIHVLSPAEIERPASSTRG